MEERRAQSLREPDVERELEKAAAGWAASGKTFRFSTKALLEFIGPYYAGKDIMHDLWHIALVLKAVDRILSLGIWAVDRESLTLAACFHGFIYRAEDAVRSWLGGQGYDDGKILRIVTIAWESQRGEAPETLEGKILHDAHVLEGGRTYLVVKTLITGSLRGQTLAQTLDFMEQNVLGRNRCYLPQTTALCAEMNQFAEDFYRELLDGIR